MKLRNHLRNMKKIILAFVAIFLFSNVQLAKADECFPLSTPMRFGDDIQIKEICKKDIDRLMKLPLGFAKLSITGKIFYDDTNCNNLDSSLSPDINCSLLEQFKNNEVAKPKVTYLKKFDLSQLDKIPANLFIGFVSEQEGENFKKSKLYHKTLKFLLKEGLLENYSYARINNSYYLKFEFEGYRYVIKEIIRADFNNDGIEDIFIDFFHAAKEGSYKSHPPMILTKKSEHDIISNLYGSE